MIEVYTEIAMLTFCTFIKNFFRTVKGQPHFQTTIEINNKLILFNSQLTTNTSRLKLTIL